MEDPTEVQERNEPITEQWLERVGFKWHQLERQNHKHWLLWLGSALDHNTSVQDIGIEVSKTHDDRWFCWFRSDFSHRYHRFLHVRYIQYERELKRLVGAITGQPWNPENHLYGSVHTPDKVARIRQEDNRLDRQILRQNPKWYEPEKDDSMGGALPEHLVAHEKAK